ncbi:hypothetical protein [Natranaerofaba carboxydovora]|uniref:hypothetical protein n=1 Tax=Natranaerofaba carboxydovora TaxID=2742683 RepID=UPI001F1476F3|nr:hypothetical protein [Natranaerofaba carboxydovora]UMZ73738.1 hypothetical protein ACONDI_01304 [Natranaerofaba carboxydovora]
MRLAGGIISLIASIIAVGMAFVTLFIGGVGGAFGAEEAGTVTGLGWAGLFLSFLLIVISVVVIVMPSTKPAIGIIVLSILTAIFGGTLVAIFMVLALLGGIMAIIGAKNELQVNTS